MGAAGTQSPAKLVGLILGIASATTGVTFQILGIRFWQVLVVAALLIGLIRVHRRIGPAFHILGVDIAFYLFFAGLAVSEYINATELNYDFDLRPILQFVFIYLGYVSSRLAVSSISQAIDFLRAFVAPVFLIAPLALAQAFGNEQTSRFLLEIAPGVGASNRLEVGKFFRATGLIGHWVGLGGYFLLIVSAAIAMLLLSRIGPTGDVRLRAKNPTPLNGGYALSALLCGFVGAAATLTFSILASALAVVILTIARFGRGASRGFLILSFGGLAGLIVSSVVEARFEDQFVTPDNSQIVLPEWVPNTIDFRVRIWLSQTIPMALRRPITGWGADLYQAVTLGPTSGRQYPSELYWVSAESQWFWALVLYGVIGLLALLVLLAAAYRLLVSASKNRYSASAAWPLLMAFCAVLLASFTAPIFTVKGFPLPFWVLMGVIASISRLTQGSHPLPQTTSANEAPFQMR